MTWVSSILLWILPSLGQWGTTARLEGTGLASLLLSTGAEALFGHPSGLSEGEGWSVIQGYRMPYALPDYTQLYFGTSWAWKGRGIGLGLWSQGIGSDFRETHFILGLAFRMRSWALALRPRFYVIQAKVPGSASLSRGLLMIDWGVTWVRGPLRLGVVQQNVTHQRIQLLEVRELLPAPWGIALRYERPARVYWMVALGPRGQGRIGVESWFTPGFCVRMGVDQQRLTIGMGLRSGRFALDFSGKSHRDLGTTYGIALRYEPF